jgi:hypothetical protein
MPAWHDPHAKSGQLAVVSDVGFSLRVQGIDRAFGELGHVMSPDFRVGTKKASRKGLRKHNMACPEVLSRANQACGYKKQVSATLVTSSSGTALAAMAEVSEKTLPSGYSYEWTGTAYQEVAASGQTGAILGLAVQLAFLFLVGLYESCLFFRPRASGRSGRGRQAPSGHGGDTRGDGDTNEVKGCAAP